MRCLRLVSSRGSFDRGQGVLRRGITRQMANALCPQFPGDGERDRTDHQPHGAKHLETAQASHEDPGEGQMRPLARDHRPHDFVAAEKHRAAQAQREKRRGGGACHGELQGDCRNGRITEERDQREGAGDRAPDRGVRYAGDRVRDP